MEDLDQCLARLKHVPPAPRLLPELLDLLQKEDIDAGRVVNLILFDPGLTASVLQLCNSAFYAPPVPVADLQHAINWLGFRQIYQLVAGVVGGRTLGSLGTEGNVDRDRLWEHAVAAAVAARILARSVDEDENVAFTAALLHDIGKLVLADAYGDRYGALMRQAEAEESSVVPVEKRALGMDHTEIGAHLLSRWRFPERIVHPVRYHHAPLSATTDRRLVACVHLADVTAHVLGRGSGDQPVLLRHRGPALEVLGTTTEAMAEVLVETASQVDMVQSLFGKLPARSPSPPPASAARE